MPDHKVYRDENGDYLIRASGLNDFFIHTVDNAEPPEESGSVPGAVASFSYFNNVAPGTDYTSCTNTNLTFNWTPPLDNGGSAITRYEIRSIGNTFVDHNYWSGDPSVLNYYALQMCSGSNVTSPLILGPNDTSFNAGAVRCDIYSFQIAAVNAHGTGVYYPNTSSDLLFPNRGFATVPNNRGYSYLNLGEGSVEISYDSSSCSPDYPLWVSNSGDLYLYDSVNPAGSSKVDTDVNFDEINAGKLFFSGHTPGYYIVRIWETWAQEEGPSCTVHKNSCLELPFPITE